MKKNRSNIFTDGICNTLKDDKNLKMVFFELDFENHSSWNWNSFFKVKKTYKKFELDYFIHRTGKGLHFLSPTLVDKILYKKFMNELKDINTKCPMTTLRTKPNKYENEKDYFYNIIEIKKFSNNKKANCKEMCNFFNETFNKTEKSTFLSIPNFEGTHKGKIIKVKYPLPYPKEVIKCLE